MSMTILNVAYPLAEVGPDAAGGAEQVLSHIDHALIAAGHRSVVIACGGSRVAGELIALPRFGGALTPAIQHEARQRCAEMIDRALLAFAPDLVHLHGVDCLEYLPPPDVPVLITLHLPPSFYPPDMFRLNRPRTWLHCVSYSQMRACPPAPNMLDPICNGVPATTIPRVRRRHYVAAIGRICPEKGFKRAIEAARLANVPLLLAGRVYEYPEHRAYFDEQIVPRLGDDCRFIGPVKQHAKQRLLAWARCLLVTSHVAETSSLVAMETLAAGTPVVAFACGALPEILEHGRTGFIVDSVGEMARAIDACASLRPEDCLHAARERFSVERMTRDHLGRYEALIASHAPTFASQEEH